MSIEHLSVTFFSLFICCQATDDHHLSWSNKTTTISAIAVSVGVLIAVCVVLVFMCTDCYNAEVDTSNHPACRGGKGGRGGGYCPTNTDIVNEHVLQSSFQTNEYVNPSSNNAPLPYTMIPTHIPEESGFSGYEVAPTASQGGVAGYTSTTGGMSGYGAAMQATAPVVTGRHVNPVEPEEPPPPYNQALHGYQ